MNYKNLKISKSLLTKVAINLTVFCVLFIAVFAIFSQKESAAVLPSCTTISGGGNPGTDCLQNCATLPSTTDALPGTNCLYLDLPPCSSIVSPEIPKHRDNCADLIDLPLCDLGTTSFADDDKVPNKFDPLPKKNCVNECNNAAFNNSDTSLVRGFDYAVHGVDCVRFSDNREIISTSPETRITCTDSNCTSRKCHQLLTGIIPDSSSTSSGINCQALSCNLLTLDELRDTKFLEHQNNKYCDGSTVKCYTFAKAKLPYIKYRNTNPMCQIHNCKPRAPSCGTDEIPLIRNRELTEPNFVSDYQTYINAGLDIDSNTLCKSTICRPIVTRQYTCDGTNHDERNTLCNNYTSCPDGSACTAGSTCPDSSTCPSSICSTGFCSKTMDCNLPAFINEPECSTPEDANDPLNHSEDGYVDTINSWFYRPKPMDIAVANDTFYNAMEHPDNPDGDDNICYSQDQFEEHFNDGDGHIPGHLKFTIPWVNWTIDLGYFHMPYPTRSPGMCRTYKGATRGPTYVFLCGNNFTSFDRLNQHDQDTAYYRGFVRTQFTNNDAIHKVDVCLRFKNWAHLNLQNQNTETCGARQCSIICAFGACELQYCGSDVCRTLVVSDQQNSSCMMTNALYREGDFFALDSGASRDCMKTIDNSLRLRAVKYGHRVCTFLDVKGQWAHDDTLFFHADTKLKDGVTCASGIADGNGGCTGGVNTSTEPWSAQLWRTNIEVPYVRNNRPSGTPTNLKGYVDLDGRLFHEQECPQVPLRISPPQIFNLANLDNSLRLFAPPLMIENAYTKKGGGISNPSVDQQFGSTDFNEPQIAIRFGTESAILSLSIDKTGYETENQDTNASVSLTTRLNTATFSIEAAIKKEPANNGHPPLLCLYQKVKDINNVYLDPVKISCVERKYPEINNNLPSSSLKQVIISADPVNSYNNGKILLKYCMNSSCTAPLSLSNTNITTQTCKDDVERYKICAKREECNKLNNECIVNEIALQNAKYAGKDISNYLAIQQDCTNNLLPNCNRKRGIATTSESITLLDPNAYDDKANQNAYGWFNELCITSGFETKLKNVLAYKLAGGIRGKCITTAGSPRDCPSGPAGGGQVPKCNCLEAPAGGDYGAEKLVRKETPREAGLCIDLPVAHACPAINYVLIPNPSDPDYIDGSINNSEYGTGSGKVDLSHKYRTFGKADSPAILLKGHAEFPRTVFGVDNVEGECRGFWQYARKSSILVHPTMSCLINADGSASWGVVSNQCVRYSCRQIYEAESDQSGNYRPTDHYTTDAETTDETKGSNNAFANWPSFTKTSDAPETVEAMTDSPCIPGFKKQGSSAVYKGGKISNYTGGLTPVRECNQLGRWNAPNPTRICERIYCPAISPNIPTSTDSSQSALWAAWFSNGGASFVKTPASRSISSAQNSPVINRENPTAQQIASDNLIARRGSIAVGTCNQDLGFYPAPGGLLPTRECDSNGNWGPIANNCVTKCGNIEETDLNLAEHDDLNNGNATWDKVNLVASGATEVEVPARNCAAGYSPYPYSKIRDAYGNPSPTADISAPIDLLPKRVCKLEPSIVGSETIWTPLWHAASSYCVKTCPAGSIDLSSTGNVDSRLNVGVTNHPVSFIDPITHAHNRNIAWKETAIGEDDVKNSGDLAGVTATQFSPSRTNNIYILRRHCGAGGKWDAPIAVCNASLGQVGNATYNGTTATSSADNIASPALTGTCITNFWHRDAARNEIAAPQVRCSYKDDNKYIDQVYWKLVEGFQDCRLVSCPAQTIGGVVNTALGQARTAATDVVESNFGTPPATINCAVNAALVGGNPSVTCQGTGANIGTWSDIADETNCILNCISTSPSTTVGTTWGLAPSSRCGMGGFKFLASDFDITTLANGATTTICRYRVTPDDCYNAAKARFYYGFGHANMSITCNNGILTKTYGAQAKNACDGTSSARDDLDKRHTGEQVTR